MNVWEEIERQKEEAKNSNKYPLDLKFLEDVGLNGIEKVIKESKEKKDKPGLIYHTKNSAIASHHWVLGDRVLVYLNPQHLSSGLYNDIEEYLLNEYGCSMDFFKSLMDQKCLYTKLEPEDEYPDKFKNEIKYLFANYTQNIVFNKVIETGIASYLKANNFNQLLRCKEESVKSNNKIAGLNTLPQQPMAVRNVRWSNPNDKVVENYAKLDIIRELLQNGYSFYMSSAGYIVEELAKFRDINLTGQSLADFSYDSFLRFGTPIFYNLGSSRVVAGIQSFSQEYERCKISDSNGKKSIKDSLQHLGGKTDRNKNINRKISNLESKLNGWGRYVRKCQNNGSNLDGDVIIRYEESVINTVKEINDQMGHGDAIDYIARGMLTISSFFPLHHGTLILALIGQGFSIPIIKKLLKNRGEEGSIKMFVKQSSKVENWKKYVIDGLQLNPLKGYYKDTLFKIGSLSYIRNNNVYIQSSFDV